MHRKKPEPVGDVYPVLWQQHHFAASDGSILAFTQATLNKNEMMDKDITRQGVQWLWDGEVMRVFGRDHPLRDSYLDQVC